MSACVCTVFLKKKKNNIASGDGYSLDAPC
jgi:hypothetical protein